MSLIYKYANISNAIKILKSGKIILTNPLEFNDPFDSELLIKNEDYEKAIELIKNYCFFKVLSNKTNNKNIKKMMNEIKKEKIYKYNEFNILGNFSKKNDINFINNIKKKVDEIRNSALIGCFSKTNNNILMWSHYADSHKGVCIEFEEERKNIFKDVSYSETREYFDINFVVSKLLAFDFLNKKYDLNDNALFDKIMKPFYVKSKDWEYEQEIRCVLSNNECPKNIDDKKYGIDMKIKKIYLGIRVENNDELKELIEIAKEKNVEIVYMKEDKNKFAVSSTSEKCCIA